jgi:D-psicose/D-tagatose/L-ribulose 3-epimerase
MKTGFNLLLWTTYVTEEHLPLIDGLKAAGYDGVEIPIFQGTPEHYRRLGGAIADAGLKATTVGVVPDDAHNPISADAAARAGGVEHLKWLVDCSVALGAEVLCGPFHQPLGQFSGTGPTGEERARAVEAHRVMADHAAKDGLILGIEPLSRFECYFLNTGADAAALVAAVDRPNYGYLYDTFHANIEEKDPVGVIGETISAISHVHISENDRGAPGRGHIDMRAAIQALKAAGYDGWFTVEAFGQSMPDIAAATKIWRKMFASEDEVVAEGLRAIRGGWAD